MMAEPTMKGNGFLYEHVDTIAGAEIYHVTTKSGRMSLGYRAQATYSLKNGSTENGSQRSFEIPVFLKKDDNGKLVGRSKAAAKIGRIRGVLEHRVADHRMPGMDGRRHPGKCEARKRRNSRGASASYGSNESWWRR